MSELNYWQRMNRRRLSRRTMLSASAKAGVGAAGLALVGCGDDDDDSAPAVTEAEPAEQAQAQAQAQVQAQVQAQAEVQAEQAEMQAEAEEQAQVEAEEQVTEEAEEEQAVAALPLGGSASSWDGSDLASFDGFLTFGYKAFLHGHYVYPMLTQFASNPGRAPTDFAADLWLAETAEQVDGSTWIFKIHDNANWENFEPVNGRPVTSEDVKFAYSGDRYANYPNRGALLAHLDTIDTPDEKTVVFNNNKPLGPFLLYLGHHAGPYVMPPELVENEGTRQRMIGAGPFSLELGQYDVGTRVTYRRNPDYFLPNLPGPDEVIVNFIADTSAQVAAAITGEINLTGAGNFNTNVIGEVRDAIPDATYIPYTENVIAGISFDLRREPFNDPRVRQALNNAVDRDSGLAVSGDLQAGTGDWASSMINLAPWFLDPRPEDSELHEFFKFDLARANGLLDAAGVTPGDVGPINFAIPAANVYGGPWNQTALLYAQGFQDLGLDIQIEQREPAAHYSTTFNGSGNDDGASMTKSVQVIEPDEGFKNMYNGDSPRSPIIGGEEMFADSRLTELLDAQTVETDLDARIAIVFDIQRHLAEMAYLLPTPLPSLTYFASPLWTNYNPNASFAPSPSHEKVRLA